MPVECRGPKIVTSKRNIKYRPGEWGVREYEVSGGGTALWRICVLKAGGSLLIWAGGGVVRLEAVALGMPCDNPNIDNALGSNLIGENSAAAALARRLAFRLSCPVYVCLGEEFDRFTAPLVESVLIKKIQSEKN